MDHDQPHRDSPKDWYAELAEPTRKWLENLRKEDIKEIEDAIKLKRKIEASGWLFKWVTITVFSAFVGAAALGDSIGKIMNWFAHVGKP